ncbi:hypothetical protein ACFPTY_20155 [Halomonas beimenensis]|uniref:hypothetical protein n=1 Tax=Halomonas beimenensis TaxID=475662 RepID=UPI003622B042
MDQVSVAAFDDLQNQLDELEELRRNILDHLRQFVYQGVYEDADGELQKDSPSSFRDPQCLQEACPIFSLRWRSGGRCWKASISIHNETVASYRQALKTNHEHIARFEAQLNRDWTGSASMIWWKSGGYPHRPEIPQPGGRSQQP